MATKSNRAFPLALRVVDMNGIAVDTWTPFVILPATDGKYELPVYMIRIYNDSNNGVFISFNGEDAHEYLPGGKTIEVNFQTNSSPSAYVSLLPKGTILYVQGAASQGNLIFFEAFSNQVTN